MTENTSDEVAQFWSLARQQLRLNPIPSYFGTGSAEVIIPPAWAFGETPELADELLALVLNGTKTATASALRDYEAEGQQIPTVGDLAIILDGREHPRALISTIDVETKPFDEVGEEHARREGEGDLSLDFWRETHREFFTRSSPPGSTFSEDLEVVLERFELIFPRN